MRIALPKSKTIYDYFEKVLKIKINKQLGFVGLKFKKDHENTSSGEEVMDETDEPQVIKKQNNNLDD